MFDADLQILATGRESSLFEADVEQFEKKLQAAISGKRIMMIGAAGSIGSSTLMQVARRHPAALHIIDQNENGLAELVRQLRSQPDHWAADDFRALPIDYGSVAMQAFLQDQEPYDAVLNFAALKHVRSEKDPYSTLQMFETNLIKQWRLMRWLAASGFQGRLFTVSTDKAANPSSMMGASKRLMEHVLFQSSVAQDLKGTKSSTRFANVAFSNGSLPQAFHYRFERKEPLAAPANTRRYFVSMKEAGEICVLAAFIARDRTIIVPKLNPKDHLIPLQQVAEAFLRHHSLEPAIYSDELAACRMVEMERARGRWPLLITPLNTAGEKPYEEFMAEGETSEEIGLESLLAVHYNAAPTARIDEALMLVDDILTGTSDIPINKERLKHIIALVEPAFLETHQETILNLDQRL